MVLTLSSGKWGTAREIRAPKAAGAQAGITLSSVACTSAKQCVASGDWSDSKGIGHAGVVTEVSGTWGPMNEVKPPANATSNPADYFNAIRCPTAASCVTVGS